MWRVPLCLGGSGSLEGLRCARLAHVYKCMCWHQQLLVLPALNPVLSL
jgi:hypothetical protein